MREQAPAHAFRTKAYAGLLDDLTTTDPKHRYPGPPAILAPVRTACSSFAKPLPVARALTLRHSCGGSGLPPADYKALKCIRL